MQADLRRLPGLPCRLLPRVLCLAAALLLPAFAGAATTEIMSFKDVSPGMKGTGRTVFKGTTVEEFSVEIVGTMENILPKKNLILARLDGGPLRETGIMEGMSGSPVYINGKLIGAVAYSWGFAKEPICGITPIEEMLSIFDRGLDLPASPPTGPPAIPRVRRRSGARPISLPMLQAIWLTRR